MSTKNSGKKIFVEHFLFLQNNFLKNSYPLKILVKNVFGRKVFIVANSFPQE
jgi:hypothetical protein